MKLFILIIVLGCGVTSKLQWGGVSRPQKLQVIIVNPAIPALRIPISNYDRIKIIEHEMWNLTWSNKHTFPELMKQIRRLKKEKNGLTTSLIRLPLGNYQRLNSYERALRTSHEDAIKSVIEDIKDSGYLEDYFKGLGETWRSL